MTAGAKDTRIPRQVRKMGRQADETIATMRKERNGDDTPPPEAPPAPQPAQVVSPKEEKQPVDGATPPPPAAQPPHEPLKPFPGWTGDEKTWEARFRSLYGIHQQQTAQLNDMKDEVQELRQKVETLTSRPAAQPAQPGAPAETFAQRVRKALPASDLEGVDDTALETTAKIADVIYKPLADEIAALRRSVEMSTKERERDRELSHEERYARFLSEMDEKHPGWGDVNDSPDFQLWCRQRDPRTGELNDDLVKRAASRCSASMLWAIFEDFFRQTGVTPPAAAPSERPPPAVPAPVHANRQPAPASPEKETFKESFVEKRIKELAPGRFRGDPAEREKELKKYDLAMAEGRILVGQ